MMRYRLARAMGKDRYREVLKEDAELLNLYGLKLMAVECGLTAAVIDELKANGKGEEQIHPWNVVEMNEKTWKWLRPLLIRLRDAEEELAHQHSGTLAAK